MAVVTPKIYVAGHKGMVGSAIVRQLLAHGHPSKQLITRSRAELDLTDQAATYKFFEEEKPEQVYLAAAKVGGIYANHTYAGEFIYINLVIQANVINAAFTYGVRKLLFLGSSCIYPRLAKQPLTEDALLTGPLEPTNEPYAIAKIAGIKLCESYNRQYGESHGIDYRSVMPTNLYGPGDNYHPENSHVVPALIRRFHEAKLNDANEVVVWGSGEPRRELLYVDDMASACVHVMNLEKTSYRNCLGPTLNHLNIGFGQDITIREMALTIAEAVKYKGQILFDKSRPDGVPIKRLDNTRIRSLGWKPKVTFREGLELTYKCFLKNY